MHTPLRVHTALSIFLLTLSASLNAQTHDIPDSSIFSQPIALDTFTIKAGFDINAFIRRVKKDTTFYKAFRTLHLKKYYGKYDIVIIDNHGKTIAGEQSNIRQLIDDNCRKTIFLQKNSFGNYYKRSGKYRYYTSALFAHLFLTEDTVCNEDDIVSGKFQDKGTGRLEKSKYELKQLIFNPGAKISGIPFIGDRASIFEPDEAMKYNFSVKSDSIGNEPCYLFRITPKEDYKRKTIYNEMTTWFRKSDYSILARNYSLSYSTIVYDFDVTMRVKTTVAGGKRVPSDIFYDGNWHIFGKKRERVKFNITFDFDH